MRHKFISAFEKNPVMVEKGSDSETVDDAAGAESSTAVVRRQAWPNPNAEAPSLSRPTSRSKSDLIARMGHEMRTPLSAIVGFAQLMGSATPAPTLSQKRNIDRILKAGWDLGKLIDMTGDLALIESGQLSLSMESVPLEAVMMDCQALFESQSNIRDVHVTFPVFDTECGVSADRIRLHEVLGNLLSTAIEHSDTGGSVVVHCAAHGSDWMRIGIYDGAQRSPVETRGLYIPPVENPENKSTAEDETEIGVMIAKRLVELMGGTFVVEKVDRQKRGFSLDLKRVVIPVVTGRVSNRSAVGEADISKENMT